MLSPRNHALDLEKRSKSLNKTLSKTKRYNKQVCDQMEMMSSKALEEDFLDQTVDSGVPAMRQRRRTKSPPTYTDQLK